MKKNSVISNYNYKQALHLSGNSSLSFFKPIIQPKLTINQPNDIYEQEADAMADKVMRMPENKNELAFFHAANKSSLHRKCFHCEEEEKAQVKSEGSAAAGLAAPSIVHDVIKSEGQPLNATTKNFMESRFGYDFGNVLIHNDSVAHQSSNDINALAYTHGNHVVFGARQYQPNSDSGRKLLAHELTHVIQQQANSSFTIQKSPDDTGDKYKRKPPGKGAFTQADYDVWSRGHPKHTFYNGGSFESDYFYNRYTPEWFWKNGYFYAFSRYAGFKGGYIEVWLSNKGKGSEHTVIRGDIAPSSGKQSAASVKPQAPADTSTDSENPANIDPGGDFEKMFGEEIHSKSNVDIIGNGYAIEYADGTIVFYPQGGEQTIYKPRMGLDEENAYDVYNSYGEKVENITVGIDPDDIFNEP